jgi:hypothetical protein
VSREACSPVICAALTVGLLSGCPAYPGSIERFDDPVVATGYDKSAEFRDYKTFALDDKVHLIVSLEDGGVESADVPEEYAEPLLDEIEQNMKAAGYQRVGVDEKPDLGITLTGVNALISGDISTWGGARASWLPPGFGFFVPFSFDYSYRTGSLTTVMADLRNVEDAGNGDAGVDQGLPQQVRVVWTSIAYKVLDEDGAPDLSLAEELLNQAFEQSSYLRTR